MLVDESQSVTKLMEDSGSIHKPQVHGERLQWYPSGIGPNVRPRTSYEEHTQLTMYTMEYAEGVSLTLYVF